MENNLRDNFVDFIYTYQQEMPVKRITDGGYFSKQEINNFSTTTLFECYAYISRRLRIIAKALAEQKSKIEEESGQGVGAEDGPRSHPMAPLQSQHRLKRWEIRGCKDSSLASWVIKKHREQ